jgi:hypothetical protein
MNVIIPGPFHFHDPELDAALRWGLICVLDIDDRKPTVAA